VTECRIILNPTSGSGDSADEIRRLAADRGYDVEETEHEGHATELGEEAVTDGVDRLAVAGGDGTINEAVQGLVEANGLDEVTFGVIPAGTANLLATNIGIHDIEHGFEVLESGEQRQIDLGIVDDKLFVTSCIAGLPADASMATSGELKERFGSFGFVITGMQEISAFDGLHLTINAVSERHEMTWTGEALCVLIGNARRFVKQGGQANVEDGLFDVVIIEEMPTRTVVAEAVAHRLLGQDTEHVFHVQARQLEIKGLDGEAIDFSLDGELSSYDRLVAHTYPHALTVCVGPEYEPDPRYE
jgi:diacylglycerol kinase (ATP)